jgi:hypothetical protein
LGYKSKRGTEKNLVVRAFLQMQKYSRDSSAARADVRSANEEKIGPLRSE